MKEIIKLIASLVLGIVISGTFFYSAHLINKHLGGGVYDASLIIAGFAWGVTGYAAWLIYKRAFRGRLF